MDEKGVSDHSWTSKNISDPLDRAVFNDHPGARGLVHSVWHAGAAGAKLVFGNTEGASAEWNRAG